MVAVRVVLEIEPAKFNQIGANIIAAQSGQVSNIIFQHISLD